MAVSRHQKLRQTLEEARNKAKEDGSERPSPARFREVWNECKGKRSELIKKFNIGYQTFKRWLKDDPRLGDVIAASELAFIENLDARARMIALGMTIKEQNESGFEGWSYLPDASMMRYYLNTIGRRYGYGENPTDDSLQDGIETRASKGIDITNWIEKEMSLKDSSN